MTQLDDLLARVVGILEELAIPYHVGGSFASSFHGLPRTTADLDVVIELEASRADALAKSLAEGFYVSPDAMREALRDRSSFNAILLDGSFKVDFFIRRDGDFDREEFKRAIVQPVREDGSLSVRLKSAEDLILRKLEWYRAGGESSDRQWDDVLNILRAQEGGLDSAHLDRWASRLGITDLLARARVEAKLS